MILQSIGELYGYHTLTGLLKSVGISSNQKNQTWQKLSFFFLIKWIERLNREVVRNVSTDLFKQMIELLGRPFNANTFDFGQEGYVDEIYAFFDYVANLPELKDSKAARGSQHGLYVNRTYFGLYTILNDLKAEIKTTKPDWLTPRHLKEEWCDLKKFNVFVVNSVETLQCNSIVATPLLFYTNFVAKLHFLRLVCFYFKPILRVISKLLVYKTYEKLFILTHIFMLLHGAFGSEKCHYFFSQ